MESQKSASSSATELQKKGRPGPSKQCDPINSTIRLQRNQAEKQRRDRLNGYISELATLVPMVRNSSKPVDKVSVLRLAAAHMRLNFSCLNSKRFKSNVPNLPSSLIAYLDLIEKGIGGFIIVTTFSGVILFCSKCVEDFIGYQNIDFMGQSIYSYLHKKEVTFFERKVNSVISRYKNECSKKTSKVVKLHLQQRPLPRSTDIRYRKMLFRISVHSNESLEDSPSESKVSSKGKKIVKHKDFGTSAVMLMFVEPVKNYPKLNATYLLTHQDIYFTIHGLQGEIMHADQRISTITGYMPHDVQGTSAYQYILKSDVPIAMFAQNAMFTSNDGMGLITYRLRILDSRVIYLQSKGQIVYKESSNEISHFVCYNRWLSDEEGSQELKKLEDRFAPQISAAKSTSLLNGKSNSKPSCSEAPVQNPDVAYSSPVGSTHSPKEAPDSFTHPGIASRESELSTRKSNRSKLLQNFSDNVGQNLTPCVNGNSSCADLSLRVDNSEENNLVHRTFSDFKVSAMSSPLSTFDKFEKHTTPIQNKLYNFVSETHLNGNQLSTYDIPFNSFERTKHLNFDQHCNNHTSYEHSAEMNGGEFFVENFNFDKIPFQIAQDHSQKFDISAQNKVSQDFDFSNVFMEDTPNVSLRHEMFQKNTPLPSDIPFASPNSNDKQCVHVPGGKFQLIDIHNKDNGFMLNEMSSFMKPMDSSFSQDPTVFKNTDFVNSFTKLLNFPEGNEKLLKSTMANTNQPAILNRVNKSIINESLTNHSSNLHSSISVMSRDVGNGYCNNNSYINTFERSTYSSFNSPKVASYNNGSSFISSNHDNTLNCSPHTINASCRQDEFVLSSPNDSNDSVPSGYVEVEHPQAGAAYSTSAYAIPAKRKKIEALDCNNKYKSGNAQQISNTCEVNLENDDIFSEFFSLNDIGGHSQSQKNQSPVEECTTQKDTLDANINRELFNELDCFFKKLPIPQTPSAQNEGSFELAQSTGVRVTDCSNSQNIVSASKQNTVLRQADLALLARKENQSF